MRLLTHPCPACRRPNSVTKAAFALSYWCDQCCAAAITPDLLAMEPVRELVSEVSGRARGLELDVPECVAEGLKVWGGRA